MQGSKSQIDINRSQVGILDESTQLEFDEMNKNFKGKALFASQSNFSPDKSLSIEVETALKNRDYKTVSQLLEQATQNFRLINISSDTVSHLIESSEWNQIKLLVKYRCQF